MYYGNQGYQQPMPGMQGVGGNPFEQIFQQYVNQGYVPLNAQSFNMPPQLINYFNGIVDNTIQYIQSNSDKNPLRRYMFNKLAANTYQNNDFAQLINDILQFINIIVTCDLGGNYNNPQEVNRVISNSIDLANRAAMMKEFANNPAASGYFTPAINSDFMQVQQTVNQLLQKYNSITNQMNQGYGNSNQIPGMQNQMMNQGYPNQYPQNQRVPQGFNNPNMSGQINPINRVAPNSSIQPPTGNTPFRDSTQVTSNNIPNINTSYGKIYNTSSNWDYGKVDQAVEKDSNKELVENAEFKGVEDMLETESVIVDPIALAYKNFPKAWTTNNHQFHPPICAADREVYVMSIDEVGRSIIEAVPGEYNMFDYFKHATFKDIRSSIANQERKSKSEIDRIQEPIIEAVVDGPLNLEREEGVKVSEFGINISNGVTLEDSIKSLRNNNRMDQLLYKDLGKVDDIKVLVTKGILYDLIVPEMSRYAQDKLFLKSLSECKKLVEVGQLINENVNIISPSLLYAVNRRMNNIINFITRHLLSLDLTTDSFAEDIDVIMNIIGKRSDVLLGSLASVEGKVLKEASQSSETMYAELTKQVGALYGDTFDDKFLCLYEDVDIIGLNLSSEELNLVMYTDLGNLITYKSSPILYNLCKQLSSVLDPSLTGRHLITLNDGVNLRVSNGIVDKHSYLISIK